jgi:molybdopterin synthase catalytic subunit
MNTGIVTEPIRPEEVLEGLSSPKDGACLLFLGVVRDHNRGRAVSGLDYEVYQGMAERTLAVIASEASHRFGTDRITVRHRIGELQVGDVSTAIAVATPHREEAYGASRYIIEELKQRLPVWKREHYLDGETHWVGTDALPQDADRAGGTTEAEAGIRKGGEGT